MLKLKLKQAFANKGSVMFIVLLVMTVMIVLASAAYYTVSANTASLENEYKDTQTYTSATAISKMVSSALRGGTTTDAANNKLDDLQTMVSGLTNEGDFMMATGTTPVAGMFEDYTVKITYNGTSGNIATYTIETSVMYEGKTVTTSEVVTCSLVATPSSLSFDRFFTSTGLCAGDVAICVEEITSSTFFDNAFTRFIGTTKTTDFHADIICAGSVGFVGMFKCTQTDPMTWTIGNDMYFTADNSSINLYGGKLYVGNDFVWTCQQPVTANIYCMNNFYATKSGTDSSLTGDLYVAGNLYNKYDGSIMSGTGFVTSDSYKSTSNRLNVSGKVYLSAAAMSAYGVSASNSSTTFTANGLKVVANGGVALWDSAEIAATNTLINNTLGDPKYEILNIDDSKVTTQVNMDLSALSSASGYTYSKTDYLGSGTSTDTYTIKTSCTLASLVGFYDQQNKIICFDTSNAPEVDGVKTLYVRLMPNCYQQTTTKTMITIQHQWYPEVKEFDGTIPSDPYTLEDVTTVTGIGYDTALNDTFRWRCTNTGNGQGMYVLIKGDGAVIFELGEYDSAAYAADKTKGVTKYIAAQKEFVGSLDLFKAMGTTTPWNKNVSDMGAYVDDDLYSIYSNNCFLVSKIKGDVGISFNIIDSTFCGYIYAPYLTYLGKISSGSGPTVFGGMIVSSYTIDSNRAYVCAKPDPDIVQKVLGSLIRENAVYETSRSWRRVGGNA